MSDEPFVFGPNQTKWLEMLETTKRRQARGTLKGGNGGYCCLGIALLALGKQPSDIAGDTLPTDAVKALGLYDETGSPRSSSDAELACSELNDTEQLRFKEIAKRLREDPHSYFRKSS